METIFSKIINKEIPADIVYETENVLAFKDIKPQAPVHILIIPKIEIPKVTDLKGKEHASLLGEMVDVAIKLANDFKIADNG
ncbi:MAG: HIT domain-containing protein, partial [Ignavibacteriaceae bacterium]|nr:HIT domain-containing protein [Ignavibacteriaceae bacterium]